jgi:hypothetical protein
LDPLFVNYFAAKMNLRVKQNSPAIEKGSTTVAATVPTDMQMFQELQILQWELINIFKNGF